MDHRLTKRPAWCAIQPKQAWPEWMDTKAALGIIAIARCSIFPCVKSTSNNLKEDRQGEVVTDPMAPRMETNHLPDVTLEWSV